MPKHFQPDRVRAIREQQGLNISETAQRSAELAEAGVIDKPISRRTVMYIEAGDNSPSVATVSRLAAALGCEVDDFFGDDSDTE